MFYQVHISGLKSLLIRACGICGVAFFVFFKIILYLRNGRSMILIRPSSEVLFPERKQNPTYLWYILYTSIVSVFWLFVCCTMIMITNNGYFYIVSLYRWILYSSYTIFSRLRCVKVTMLFTRPPVNRSPVDRQCTCKEAGHSADPKITDFASHNF